MNEPYYLSNENGDEVTIIAETLESALDCLEQYFDDCGLVANERKYENVVEGTVRDETKSDPCYGDGWLYFEPNDSGYMKAFNFEL